MHGRQAFRRRGIFDPFAYHSILGTVAPQINCPMPPVSHLYITGVADPGTGETGTLFFTEEELHALVTSGALESANVWFEHGDQWRKNMGRISHAWVQPGEGLKVAICLDAHELCATTVFEWIKAGLFRGLSLGYKASVDPVSFATQHKDVHEISIVHTPFHPSCWIDGIFQQTGNRTHYYLDRKSMPTA